MCSLATRGPVAESEAAVPWLSLVSKQLHFNELLTSYVTVYTLTGLLGLNVDIYLFLHHQTLVSLFIMVSMLIILALVRSSACADL